MRVPLRLTLFRRASAADDDLKVAMEELWALRTEVAAAEQAAEALPAETQWQSATPSSPYAKTAVILRLQQRQNR